MTPRTNQDIIAIFENEFPKDTLQAGEAFLTLYKFHSVLKALGYSYSKSTIYRWIKVRKEYLPEAIQKILKPAPSIWYLQTTAQTDHERHAQLIPLRYLSQTVHQFAAPYALLHTTQSEVLTGLHSLRHQLNVIQSQLTQLIEEYPRVDHDRKDTSYAQH